VKYFILVDLFLKFIRCLIFGSSFEAFFGLLKNLFVEIEQN
jgi:hypothetical protein